MWTQFLCLWFINFIGRMSGSPKTTPTPCRVRSWRQRRRPRSSTGLRPRQDMPCRTKAGSIRINLEASERMARNQDGATSLQLPLRRLILTLRGWGRGQPLGQQGMRSTLLRRRASSLQDSLQRASNVGNRAISNGSVRRNENCV